MEACCLTTDWRACLDCERVTWQLSLAIVANLQVQRWFHEAITIVRDYSEVVVSRESNFSDRVPSISSAFEDITIPKRGDLGDWVCRNKAENLGGSKTLLEESVLAEMIAVMACAQPWEKFLREWLQVPKSLLLCEWQVKL